MRKLITLLLLFSFSVTLGQKENSSIIQEKSTEFKVTSISYMADSIEELETINWADIEEIFSNNEENENIELTFGVNLKKSKNKFKSSIKISGETKNLDSLIIRSKKGVNSLIKLSKKYKE